MTPDALALLRLMVALGERVPAPLWHRLPFAGETKRAVLTGGAVRVDILYRVVVARPRDTVSDTPYFDPDSGESLYRLYGGEYGQLHVYAVARPGFEALAAAGVGPEILPDLLWHLARGADLTPRALDTLPEDDPTDP